jgi:hypothetical protein
MTMAPKPHNDDFPALTMKVENGKLVCLSAWDAERLASFSHRPVVFVKITADQHPARRKFEAILNKLIKGGNVPWSNRETALDALKIAHGCVDVVKRKGELITKPASLTTLDDEAFLDFYETAMAILSEITGLDPETMGREAADTGSYEYPKSSGSPPPDSDDQGDDAPPQSSSPASSASDGGSSADGERPEQSESSSADVQFDPPLALECIRKLLAIALDPAVPEAKDRQDILKGAKEDWKGKVPNEFLRRLVNYVNEFIIGKRTEGETRRMIGTLLP